jgi:hypothetical protein
MAEPELRGAFGRPFAEQVAAFRLRQADLVGTRAWDDLLHAQHDRAFVVAGAMKAELLADLAEAVRKGIEDGTSLEEFRRDFRRIVERHGWHGWTGEGTAKGEVWRTRVIYQTNMRTSYMAGRRAQLEAGGYRFWVYRHSNAREPRLHHLAWDGLALPPDHPFWATHYPPNGWGCGCRVFGARTEAGIRRMGGDPGKRLPEGWDAADPRTGAPRGIDKGWDYAPGASVADDILATMGRKAKALPPPLALDLAEAVVPRLPAPAGARLAAALPAPAEDERLTRFHAFFDDAVDAEHPHNRRMQVGALDPAWEEAARAQGRELASAELWLADIDLRHALRGAPHRPPAKEWLRDLPRHLRQPDAVLLDPSPTRPAILFVFLDGQGDIKVAFRIDFTKGAFGPVNMLRTAERVDLSGVRGMIAGGRILKLSGNL